MATDTTPKSSGKTTKADAKSTKAKTKDDAKTAKAKSTTKTTKNDKVKPVKATKRAVADAKRRAKERAKVTSELKSSLSETAHIAGRAAGVLAADVKAGANKTTATVKTKGSEAASAGAKAASRIPKPVWSAAITMAATGCGILIKWLRVRKARARDS